MTRYRYRERERKRRIEKINENIHIIIILYKTFHVLNLSGRKKTAKQQKNIVDRDE